MKNSVAEKKKSWLMRCKAYWLSEWFDPHTSFLKLPSFWAPFIIILLLFSLLCWKVASDNHLVGSWNWTVQEMYEWFKIPFWVLALLIPIIGLFNANHKSEQAKAAMELTKSQNNFANYYKHLEEFSKYCKALEDGGSQYHLRIQSRRLHSSIYPKAKSKGLIVDAEFMQNLEDWLNALIAGFQKLMSIGENESFDRSKISSSLNILFEPLLFEFSRYIEQVEIGYGSKVADDSIISHWDLSPEDAHRINKIYSCYFAIMRVLEFDPDIDNILLPKYRELLTIIIEFQRMGVKRTYNYTK